MAVYEYKGFDSQGKTISGMIEADLPRSARAKLRQDGIFTTDLTSVSEKAQQNDIFFSDKIPLSETAVMTRQLATLLGANVPLMEALAAMIEQVEDPVHRQVWAAVRDKVREGASFADALAQHPKTFSALYRQMVKAGEASGTLDRILVRMAQYLESSVALRKKISSILAYPILMMILSGIILIFLVSFVVPKVTSIFSDLNHALPLPTVILLAISHFLRHYGWIFILLIVLAVFWLKRYVATEAGRWHYDRISITLPLVGKLFKMMAIARFAKTLATLLEAGIPLLPALAIVQDVVENKVIEKAIITARENIREGEGIAEPLKKSGLFPPLLTHLIAVGEKSGDLEPMLEKVSQSYESEVEIAVTTLTSLLGPMMILVMGGVVLFIVLAVLLPIFDLSQIIK
ncbi:MAG: type II secretion system inner membrane protein GspF [Nitrospirota bacterium]